jgi:hypothetical protein
MTSFTQDQWMIVALVFVLGLLVGMFLTSGGRRKWKTRYRDEVTRREALEKDHREHLKRDEEREKEYRSLETRHDKLVNDRSTVVHERPVTRGTTTRDVDGDGVPNRADRRPVDDTRA